MIKGNIIPLYKSSNKCIDRSKGCYQYDSDGKEYVDFESGVWCANLGHSHERIVRVMEEQARHSIHHGYRFRNRYSEQLSIELQRLIGFENGASVFLSSGSEAVNLSISIAQNLTGRKKILKISNSFLSSYGFGQIKPENQYLDNVKFNDIKSLKEIDFSNISAFVMELGGASVQMVRFPNTEFIHELVRLSHLHNCLVIADEVTTGFGRQGKWFGFQHFDIHPDMVVTGKALGNGYPISAVTINFIVLEKFNTVPFGYAQSHQNDPLGCAIGLEVIRVIKEERLINNCILMGQYFKERLIDLHERNSDKIKAVRAKGLMLAVEFQNSFDGEQLNKNLFKKGFVFGFKQNTMRLLPPLTITVKEIDKLISQLWELL